MTAYTNAIADIRINNDTRFRDQMGWIATQLENIGWTKQADTGQIDWGTVTAPIAADTTAGFEIRKPTNGPYLKIWYGSGYAAYAKSLWLQFGTETDGAGAFTNGNVITQVRQIRTATGYNGASVRAGDDYVSGDANRLSIAMTDDTSAPYGGAFALQRTTDDAGNYTTDNNWILVRAQYSVYGDYFHIAAGNIKCSPYPVAAFSTFRSTRAIGSAPGNIPFFPIYTSHPTRSFAQFRDAYCAASSLVPHQTTVTIDGRTYLSTYGGNTNATVWGFTSAVNYAFLIRYD